MRDLTERLLTEAEHRTRVGPKVVLLNEAADEIEKLETETLNQQIVIGELRKGWEAKEAEIERLRAALEEIAYRLDSRPVDIVDLAVWLNETEVIARKALEGK